MLSFGAALVGFGIGWSSLSADYTVRMPADTPAWQLFGWTYAGLNVPLILVESLGAACMSTFAARPDYEDAYNDFGVGGLLRACLSPAGGFGDFLVVVVGLGIISNNVPVRARCARRSLTTRTSTRSASRSRCSVAGRRRSPACSSRSLLRASASCAQNLRQVLIGPGYRHCRVQFVRGVARHSARLCVLSRLLDSADPHSAVVLVR